MKRCVIVPDGWIRTFEECPPGFFMVQDDLQRHDPDLCFKSEYSNDEGKQDAYCADGSFFWYGTKTIKDRNQIMVQPVKVVWENYEE